MTLVAAARRNDAVDCRLPRQAVRVQSLHASQHRTVQRIAGLVNALPTLLHYLPVLRLER